MEVVEAVDDLSEEPHRVGNGKGPSASEVIEEFAVGRELEDKIEMLLRLQNLDYFENVGMLHEPHQCDLAPRFVLEIGMMFKNRLFDDFHRILFVGAAMLSKFHFSSRSHSERVEERVLPHILALRKRHPLSMRCGRITPQNLLLEKIRSAGERVYNSACRPDHFYSEIR